MIEVQLSNIIISLLIKISEVFCSMDDICSVGIDFSPFSSFRISLPQSYEKCSTETTASKLRR